MDDATIRKFLKRDLPQYDVAPEAAEEASDAGDSEQVDARSGPLSAWSEGKRNKKPQRKGARSTSDLLSTFSKREL